MDNGKNKIKDSGQNNEVNTESLEKINLEKDSNESNIKIINLDENNKNEPKENNIDDTDNDELIDLNDFIIQIKNENNIQENQIIEKEKQKSIIQEYIENKNIIKNKDKLICFIEELSNILKTGNNNIIPYLDLCPNLIITYIESDLDEEEGEHEFKYIKIFELLKYNSFISREYLYPIYDYFSHLFYLMNSVSDSDSRINKFHKMIELWNIFYTFIPENDPQIEYYENQEKKIKTKSMKKNLSTFCFLGSGIKFEFNERITFEDCLIIEIFFTKKNFAELNSNLTVVNLTSENNNYKLSISDLQKKTKKTEFPRKIRISIIQHIINLLVHYSDNTNHNLEFPEKYNCFQELKILENFYGQIEKFSINLCQVNSNITYEYSIKPYLLNGNLIYYDNRFINRIYFIKPNLAKVNYINYLEENFDLENYFLGIKQFIPFIPLLDGIYKNQNIKNINGIDKQNALTDAFRKIVTNFISIILEKKTGKKKSQKRKPSKKNANNSSEKIQEVDIENIDKKELLNMLNIQRYDLFTFIIILQLPPELIIRGYFSSDDKTNNFITKLMQKSVGIYNNDGDDFDLFFNGLFNAMDEEEFYSEHVNEQKVFAKLEKDFCLEKPILYEFSYQQLYRKLMKELFIYNRLWSIKEFFFSNDYNDNRKENESFTKLKMKYKQISYYTKNLQQPLLYPILEINEYIPNFTNFDKKNLFKHDYKETVVYDFNLKESKVLDYVDNYMIKKGPFNQDKNKVQCCLIKKDYHVKGELVIKQIENNTKNKEYCLIFISYDKETSTTCNKKTSKKKVRKSKLDELCYGSVFTSPKKEFNRKILIKLEDVNLILIRNYFKNTSGIEIFTSNTNKSYYFNFNCIISMKDLKNPVIKLFSEIPFFQKIKFDLKKNLGGFYNTKQENLLFSIVSEELPNSIFKNVDLLNRYDLLILINLLSNRSFKDLYQYPVFPILYKTSKILENEKRKERDLSEHLGLQTITEKSEQRTELIKGLENENLTNNSSKKGKLKDNYLFNIHYSNPIYTCNYLIRIFPYSLSAIEFQGDGFDSPNRQFYSITKALENTLTQKADLREFIPELYYFPDLFFNKNNLKLGVLSKGEEIDNLYVDEKEEDDLKKFKYLEEFQNYFLNNKELDISSWIDLIFGINQEKCKEIGRDYYPKEKYIPLSKKEQKEDSSNPLNLEIVEFGIQPLKIFEEKFPDLRKINNHYYNSNLINYSLDEFYNNHLVVKNYKDACFLFEWDEKVNLNKYMNALFFNEEKVKNHNIKNSTYNNKYRFIGNILGDVIIYRTKNIINKEIDNKEEDEDNSSIKAFFSKTNKHYDDIIKNPNKIVYKLKKEKIQDEKLLIKLSDHYKQILYIDYNPRLNLFLSYGLDGYINIYAFPKCKLVRTIKVKDITKSDDLLKKVALISIPFPMIFFHDNNYLYSLTINGDLINKKEMPKNCKIFVCIDKNLGLMVDSILEIIFYIDNNGNEKYDIKTLSLPSLDF